LSATVIARCDVEAEGALKLILKIGIFDAPKAKMSLRPHRPKLQKAIVFEG